MSDQYPVYCSFPGRLVILGFGSIGQGVLPLILRHIGISPDRITIISADPAHAAVAERAGIGFLQRVLTEENWRAEVSALVGLGDFLLNLSVDVSSIDLMDYCASHGALYLDTCVEPWPGGYTDNSLSPSDRSNYRLRENVLELQASQPEGAPTQISGHGANPGLVSHFVKQALVNIAEDSGLAITAPQSRGEWAALAQKLGVKTIHVAERDTQVAAEPKQADEFVNTWSVDGFISEGSQPAELGWGTHEKQLPEDAGVHDYGRSSAIFLNRPGATTRVRTWTPQAEAIHGYLITHGEAITLSDYLTVREGDVVVYRPSVHYAYHPCDDAILSLHEFAGRNLVQQQAQRIMMDEIVAGIDELGVLLAGHARNAYWYGSQLSIEEARALAPSNNATSLQVTIAVLAGMIWAIENPNRGVVEPEDMDHQRILEICRPYLGPVVGVYSDWTPLVDRETLFEEDIDRNDPWQFKNVRVV